MLTTVAADLLPTGNWKAVDWDVTWGNVQRFPDVPPINTFPSRHSSPSLLRHVFPSLQSWPELTTSPLTGRRDPQREHGSYEFSPNSRINSRRKRSVITAGFSSHDDQNSARGRTRRTLWKMAVKMTHLLTWNVSFRFFLSRSSYHFITFRGDFLFPGCPN